MAAAVAPAAALANENVAARPGIPQRWRDLMMQLEGLSPGCGFEVARLAYEAGFDLDDLACINLSGGQRGPYTVMLFDARNGGYHSVSPAGVLRCTWVRP